MEFNGIIDYPLLDLGLSQIYLNSTKIELIEEWLRLDDMSIFQPLSVHDYGNGRYTIVDGHSRAFVAYKKGIKTVPIIYDRSELVAGDIALQLYNADIEWCNRFQIEKISDLENRIITREEYRRLWIERCDRSYDLLTQTTEKERRLIQERAPELYLYGAEEDLSEFYFEDDSGKLYVYRDKVLSVETVE